MYQCEYCNQKFPRKSSLTAHLKWCKKNKDETISLLNERANRKIQRSKIDKITLEVETIFEEYVKEIII